MGKEAKRRQLAGEAEAGKALNTSTKRMRESGLSNKRSQDARKDESEVERDEKRLEESIEELLVECRRRAKEGSEETGQYKPGEELHDRKRPSSSLGWAGLKMRFSRKVQGS